MRRERDHYQLSFDACESARLRENAELIQQRDSIAAQTWEQAAKMLRPALETEWLDAMDEKVKALEVEFTERAQALRSPTPETP